MVHNSKVDFLNNSVKITEKLWIRVLKWWPALTLSDEKRIGVLSVLQKKVNEATKSWFFLDHPLFSNFTESLWENLFFCAFTKIHKQVLKENFTLSSEDLSYLGSMVFQLWVFPWKGNFSKNWFYFSLVFVLFCFCTSN